MIYSCKEETAKSGKRYETIGHQTSRQNVAAKSGRWDETIEHQYLGSKTTLPKQASFIKETEIKL